MLFSTQCSFDTTLDPSNDLKKSFSREYEIGCAGFGGWLRTRVKDEAPRIVDNNGNRTKEKKLPQSDMYYKRYRVDPQEGTFKHFKNMSQYMQMYRESNTLCYKQKTLDELTSLYSAALDINRSVHPASCKVIERRLRRLEARRLRELQKEGLPQIVGAELMVLPKIGLDIVTPDKLLDHSRQWEFGQTSEDQHVIPLYSNTVPPITSHSESGVPLMLLPNAPSIPHRLNQHDQSDDTDDIWMPDDDFISSDDTVVNPPSPLSVASFMCNAYMNRNIICPVHKMIHGRSVMINTQCTAAAAESFGAGGGVDRHVKVTLPGIPKRRYNNQAKRLRALRESHPIIGAENSQLAVVPPNTTSPLRDDVTDQVLEGEEEDENSSESRISTVLSCSASDRVNTALQKKRAVPSLQLSVTALLNYSPYNPEHCVNRPLRIRRSLISKGQKVRPLPRKVEEPPKKKRDIQRQAAFEPPPIVDGYSLPLIDLKTGVEPMDQLSGFWLSSG